MALASNGLEKHAQTAIQVILVAITIWVGNSILLLRDSSIRVEEKNTQLRETVIELKNELASIKLSIAANAERDIAMKETVKDLASRIEQVEKRSHK